jgi:hypothetical protein
MIRNDPVTAEFVLVRAQQRLGRRHDGVRPPGFAVPVRAGAGEWLRLRQHDVDDDVDERIACRCPDRCAQREHQRRNTGMPIRFPTKSLGLRTDACGSDRIPPIPCWYTAPRTTKSAPFAIASVTFSMSLKPTSARPAATTASTLGRFGPPAKNVGAILALRDDDRRRRCGSVRGRRKQHGAQSVCQKIRASRWSRSRRKRAKKRDASASKPRDDRPPGKRCSSHPTDRAVQAGIGVIYR